MLGCEEVCSRSSYKSLNQEQFGQWLLMLTNICDLKSAKSAHTSLRPWEGGWSEVDMFKNQGYSSEYVQILFLYCSWRNLDSN